MSEIKLGKIKIGWAIANASLDVPAYRRRFGFYLNRRNLTWKIADINKSYDLVVVHHSADITAWRNYNRAKIILDYNDDYLSGDLHNIRNSGRGCAKFLFRHWSKLEFDYRKAYTKMMQRADAIVCCTDAQESHARQYCPNVFQILDMQCDPDWVTKENYDVGSISNLVWEGLPGFDGLMMFAPIFRSIQAKQKCALHVITALKHRKYIRNFIQVNTWDELQKIPDLKNVYLYEWNPHLFSHIVSSCDLAVIPIDMRQPFWVSKPGNKLLFFWRIAMPALVDPTPSYIKLMDECGLDMVCRSQDEWLEKLDLYLNDKEKRLKSGKRAKEFVEQKYGNEQLLSQWDDVILSIL
jgi:hypothetical protein